MKGLERMSPRGRAWLCATLNQFAFPGLGTILAGRKIGYVQAALMLVGFILATGFLLWYIFAALCYMANSDWTEAMFRAQYAPLKWALHLGLFLCSLAWTSALFSSISIARRVK
jgi:hypothetical protein